jgi:hypothetical protein
MGVDRQWNLLIEGSEKKSYSSEKRISGVPGTLLGK